MTTLFGLLINLCLAMPVAGALSSAQLAHTGVKGYVVATLVGLVLGAACAWILRKFGHFVLTQLSRNPVPANGVYFGGLYFAAVVWVVFALFAGNWTSSLILRLIF